MEQEQYLQNSSSILLYKPETEQKQQKQTETILNESRDEYVGNPKILVVSHEEKAGKTTLIHKLFGNIYSQNILTEFGSPKIIEKQYSKMNIIENEGSIWYYNTKTHEPNLSSMQPHIEKFLVSENGKHPNERVHLVWYLMRWNSNFMQIQQHYFSPAIKTALETHFKNLPVFIIVTHLDEMTPLAWNHFVKTFEKMQVKNVVGIFGVSSLEKQQSFTTFTSYCFDIECMYSTPYFIDDQRTLVCPRCKSKFGACPFCSNSQVNFDYSSNMWNCSHCNKTFDPIKSAESEELYLITATSIVLQEYSKYFADALKSAVVFDIPLTPHIMEVGQQILGATKEGLKGLAIASVVGVILAPLLLPAIATTGLAIGMYKGIKKTKEQQKQNVVSVPELLTGYRIRDLLEQEAERSKKKRLINK